jgi:hypothetical protein
LWLVREDQNRHNSDLNEVLGNHRLTISAKPVGVGAASQLWILAGERSLSLTHIATTESISLFARMKSGTVFSWEMENGPSLPANQNALDDPYRGLARARSSFSPRRSWQAGDAED